VLTIVSKESGNIVWNFFLLKYCFENSSGMITGHFHAAIIHKQKENVNKIVVIFFLYRKNYF